VAGIALPELHDLAGSRPHWIVPGERTKNKRDHLVPLSPAALKVVKQAKALLSEEDAFLFMSSRKDNGRIGAHALTVAMRRFCEPSKAMPGSLSEKSPHHMICDEHSRHSSRAGVPKEDREACLNHTRNDVGSKHYDLTTAPMRSARHNKSLTARGRFQRRANERRG
jgi:integrase